MIYLLDRIRFVGYGLFGFEALVFICMAFVFGVDIFLLIFRYLPLIYLSTYLLLPLLLSRILGMPLLFSGTAK